MVQLESSGNMGTRSQGPGIKGVGHGNGSSGDRGNPNIGCKMVDSCRSSAV